LNLNSVFIQNYSLPIILIALYTKTEYLLPIHASLKDGHFQFGIFFASKKQRTLFQENKS
jgi:hypothetical protein